MKKFLVAAALVAAVSAGQAFAVDTTVVVTGTVPAVVTANTISATGTGVISGFTNTSAVVVSGDYDTTVDIAAVNNQSTPKTITATVTGSGSANANAGFLTPDFGTAFTTADNSNSVQVAGVKLGATNLPGSVLANGNLTDSLILSLASGGGTLPAGSYKGTVVITLAD